MTARKSYIESCREKGRKGGKATGACKRRSPEHYRMMAKKSAEARLAKKHAEHARDIGPPPPPLD